MTLPEKYLVFCLVCALAAFWLAQLAIANLENVVDTQRDTIDLLEEEIET